MAVALVVAVAAAMDLDTSVLDLKYCILKKRNTVILLQLRVVAVKTLIQHLSGPSSRIILRRR